MHVHLAQLVDAREVMTAVVLTRRPPHGVEVLVRACIGHVEGAEHPVLSVLVRKMGTSDDGLSNACSITKESTPLDVEAALCKMTEPLIAELTQGECDTAFMRVRLFPHARTS